MEEVCRCANVLKSKGVTKGDRVAVYMPMILELPIVMLACTRIGAIHSVVVIFLFIFVYHIFTKKDLLIRKFKKF